ncbi:MAG: winged helix DNA-binding domain-containing protein [Thermoanaerobaculia bacterium]
MNARETLSRRAVNRATLARQMLLQRKKVKPLVAIEKLAGLQSQLARPPFIGLWTRLENFRREDLLRLIEQRNVVRATWIRATIHLLTQADYIAFRSTIQPSLAGGMPALRTRADFDAEALLATGRDFFAEPHTFDEFRKFLLERDADVDERTTAYAVRLGLPMTVEPAAGRWGYSSVSRFKVAERVDPQNRIEEFVLRYLAAFGPASVNDMQTWSAMRNLRGVFKSLRPKLATFRDENDKELFDLPKAPRPGEDVDAPVRFLPDYDNLTLAFADRSRVIATEHRKLMFTANLGVLPAFLVDGVVAGTWKIERKKLVMNPFVNLSKRVKAELDEEGEKLVRFVEGDQ